MTKKRNEEEDEKEEERKTVGDLILIARYIRVRG